jgi:hypothetical protein
MSKYVPDHHLQGERARLALMSRLLGIGPGARTLEVRPGGRAIAFTAVHGRAPEG